MHLPPSAVARCSKRISGPLLDRIDIHVDVPRVNYEKLTSERLGEPSVVIRERVRAARTLHTNADMGGAEVREWCRLDSAGQSLMRAAMRQLQLSARAYHRAGTRVRVKLAWTIADVAGAEQIGPAHLAEAVQYRLRRAD